MFLIRDFSKLINLSKNVIELPNNLRNQAKIKLDLSRERTYEKFNFELNTSFYDNSSIVGHSAKTIVAIHGTPGAPANFDSMFRTMTKNGVCIIVPEMPGN